ncbi:hypothetical protein EDC56_1356 [Sinobacterium caligoides]|uniref:Uncharacterized protein n=1 Tax=Sinobacterium caligoides TaxID=933926 RepID=A0A3N2E1J3_9GAMM|nr:hypothetical protein EDC56_1356 [Sinobacterium caligoides]
MEKQELLKIARHFNGTEVKMHPLPLGEGVMVLI